jgi:hypothetical protein
VGQFWAYLAAAERREREAQRNRLTVEALSHCGPKALQAAINHLED